MGRGRVILDVKLDRIQQDGARNDSKYDNIWFIFFAGLKLTQKAVPISFAGVTLTQKAELLCLCRCGTRRMDILTVVGSKERVCPPDIRIHLSLVRFSIKENIRLRFSDSVKHFLIFIKEIIRTRQYHRNKKRVINDTIKQCKKKSQMHFLFELTWHLVHSTATCVQCLGDVAWHSNCLQPQSSTSTFT